MIGSFLNDHKGAKKYIENTNKLGLSKVNVGGMSGGKVAKFLEA